MPGGGRDARTRATPAWGCASSSTTWRRSASAAEIVAEATLEKVEGRRLVFTVTATDAAGLVGAGKVTRVVVGREDFLAKAR